MATFITAITNIIHNTFTRVFYPGYIEDEKGLVSLKIAYQN